MDPKYGERYRDLFDRHWWWRARTEFIVGILRRLQPPGGWPTILDIGCGDGLFFHRLREFGEVEGVEPFAELVRPDNPDRNRIYTCTFDERFRPSKLYSLILMLDVLEHLENPAGALRHALDLLAPDGRFVVTVPAFEFLWTNHDVLNHHFIRYTRSSFRDLAQQAGFQIFQERYMYHWTFFAKLGVRLYERLLRPKPEPASVPPDWVNTPLYWLSRIEQKTVTWASVPFGSSLMVIGGQDRRSSTSDDKSALIPSSTS
ncbi:MAG TPA: class I SAM-dependent methyltransferase [Candidatus Sulfotelmatobacter sp.]|jgi:SAM-dependent methyltransferase|nr:class I SAM-dependent methyltransferase [Candidatus Sulfotelmatobacter sp.]